MAARRRSVLKMLNSLSSATKPSALGLLAGEGRAFLEADRIHPREAIERGRQRLAVGGEVLDDLERRADRRNRDEIGGRKALGDVVVSRGNRPLELLGLHRARVEQQHDQAPILEVDRLWFRCGDGNSRRRRRL